MKLHGRAVVAALIATISLLVGALLAPTAAAYTFDPGPVTNVSANSGNGTLTISWTEANPGAGYSGTPYTIVKYTVRATRAGYSGTVATCESQITSCTLTGLENGVDHWIQITATNSVYGTSNVWGAGPWKACCSVPSAPNAVAATAGNGTASVSWTPPSNAVQAVGPFEYHVTSEPALVDCRTTGQSCEFTGLANGASYTFVVTASTRWGTSAGARSPAVTPKGLPGAPTSVVGFVGSRGSVDVTWLGPATTGGAVITRYIATASPGGAVCESTGALSCKISGLSNGQSYTFTVVAMNEVGAGPASEPSPAAKQVAGPGKPTSIAAKVTGRNSASISWKPPTSTGGLKITYYVVKPSPGGKSCKTSKTSCTVGGLSAGTSYVFTVQAFNAKGPGMPGQSKSITTQAPKQTQVIAEPTKQAQEVG